MPHERTKQNEDLPLGLYAPKGAAFRYYRKDTGRGVSIGKDRAIAIEAAEIANEVFDVYEVKRLGTRMPKSWYRMTALAYFREKKKLEDMPEMVKKIFADFDSKMGAKKNNKPIENWSNTASEGREYAGSAFIKVSDLDPDNLPRWANMLLANSRKNAKTRNIDFNLDQESLTRLLRESSGRCAVSGIRLRLDETKRKNIRRPWAPSIDRIDSFSGYSEENCRIVCVAANIAMGQWGDEILISLAKGIARKNVLNQA